MKNIAIMNIRIILFQKSNVVVVLFFWNKWDIRLQAQVQFNKWPGLREWQLHRSRPKTQNTVNSKKRTSRWTVFKLLSHAINLVYIFSKIKTKIGCSREIPAMHVYLILLSDWRHWFMRRNSNSTIPPLWRTSNVNKWSDS